MKSPTPEEQRQLVRLRDETARVLDRMRREALRGMPYRWEEVDALLQLAEHYDGPPRTDSGLVEMQRWFMLAAKRQGLMSANNGDASNRRLEDGVE